jgi:vancomycin resistance protein YoaR
MTSVAEPVSARAVRPTRPIDAGRSSLLLLLTVELVALVVTIAVFAFEASFAGRVYPGISVAGLPVGGLSLEQARSKVEAELPSYMPGYLKLRYEDQTWSIPLRDLGLSLGSSDAAARAYSVGRAAHEQAAPDLAAQPGHRWVALVADLFQQWSAFVGGRSIEATVALDEARVAEQVRQFAAAIDQAPQDGFLRPSDAGYVPVAGKPGLRVDVRATTQALIAALRQKQPEPVPITVQEIAPALRDLNAVAAQANLLASAPFTLTLSTPDGPKVVPLEAATVRQWLELSAERSSGGEPELVVRLNRTAAEGYLAELAKELERPAQDARLDLDPEKRQIVILQPGQVGRSLDVEAGLTGIESALQRAEHVLPLEVRAVQPAISSDPLLVIDGVELIAEGTTKFAGSSKARVQNIAVGADKFKGVVVPTGAEFSFNKYVGEIDAANGFTEGLVIWGDRTAVGIGGGICQVSTTVFRAAFYAGFPITQRTAHGYVVSWYGEPGLDATIFTPDVDLRFRNDTNGPLFIKPRVDLKTGTLTFAFYGQRQPRTVEMVGPQISNKRPAPPPVYQEDKSLPQGTIKQVDWAKEGQDVVVIRKIRTAERAVSEEKFESHYQPWRAVFLYGPGTALPPGATTGGQD